MPLEELLLDVGPVSAAASGFAPLLVIMPLVELSMVPLVEPLVETVPLLMLPLLEVGAPPVVELDPGSPLVVAPA
jgi:hypothetical protein